jgi:hypothetical protein
MDRAELVTGLGYSSVKGLVPFHLGQGIAISVLPITDRRGQSSWTPDGISDAVADEIATFGERRMREQVLSVIREVVPVDPIELLLTMDEQNSIYTTYADGLCGGMIFAKSSSSEDGSPHVVSGRARPYGMSYLEAWNHLTSPEFEIRLTNGIICRPIIAIPEFTGKFGYYQIGPGIGLLCGIPGRDGAGNFIVNPMFPEYMIGHVFAHMCLAPVDDFRSTITEIRDETRVYNLIKPWIWNVPESSAGLTPQFIREEEWLGRKTTYGAPYLNVPFPLSGRGPGDPTGSSEPTIESNIQESHQATVEELAEKAAETAREVEREADRAEKEAAAVGEPTATDDLSRTDEGGRDE